MVESVADLMKDRGVSEGDITPTRIDPVGADCSVRRHNENPPKVGL